MCSAQSCDYSLTIEGFTDCDNGVGTFCVNTVADFYDFDCANDHHFELIFPTGDFIWTNLNNTWQIQSQSPFPGNTVLRLDAFSAFDLLISSCLDGIVQEIGTVFTLNLVENATSIIVSTETVLFDNTVEVGTPGTDILLTDLITNQDLLPLNQAINNGQRICIDGNLIINDDYVFNTNFSNGNGLTSEIILKKDASIRINDNQSLFLNYTKVHGCNDDKWDKILVGNGSQLTVAASNALTNVSIEDGKRAIELLDGAALTISGGSFNNNDISIGSFGPNAKNISIVSDLNSTILGPSIVIENGRSGMVFENTNLINFPGPGIITDMENFGIHVVNSDLMTRLFTITNTQTAIASTGDSELLDVREVVIQNNTIGIGVNGTPSIFNYAFASSSNNVAGIGLFGLLNSDVDIQDYFGFNETFNVFGSLEAMRGEVRNSSFESDVLNVLLNGIGAGNQELEFGNNGFAAFSGNSSYSNISLNNMNFPRIFNNPIIEGSGNGISVTGGSRAVIGENGVTFNNVNGSFKVDEEGIRVFDSPNSLIYCNDINAKVALRLLQDNSGTEIRGNEFISANENLIYGSAGNTFALVGEQLHKGNRFDLSSLNNVKARDFNSDLLIAQSNRYKVNNSTQGNTLYPFFSSTNNTWFEVDLGGITSLCASGANTPDLPTTVSLDSAITVELRSLIELNNINQVGLRNLIALKATRHLDQAGWPTLADTGLNNVALLLSGSRYDDFIVFEKDLIEYTNYNSLLLDSILSKKALLNQSLGNLHSLMSSAFDTIAQTYQLSNSDSVAYSLYHSEIAQYSADLSAMDSVFKDDLQQALPGLNNQLTPLLSSPDVHLATLAKLNKFYLSSLDDKFSGFTKSQKTTIEEVADYCAGEHGEAVYLARSLRVTHVDPVPIYRTYNDECVKLENKSASLLGEGLSTHNTSSLTTLYPNPVGDYLILNYQLTTTTAEIESVEIIDALGRSIQTFNNVINNRSLNTSSLPTGKYHVRITTTTGTIEVQSFIKQ